MRVAEVWRYPVKSMAGERLAVADIDARGLVGDRRWALRDPAGKLASGKSSRRFTNVDGVRAWTARLEGRALPELRSPEGVACEADEVARRLDRDLVLAEEDAVPHHDAEPVHLVTTASLAWLRQRLPGAPVDAGRVRANLLVEVEGDGLVEDGWVGRTLRIGSVELVVAEPTERCVMVGGDALRVVADGNDRCLGVYARVTRPGTLGEGAAVVLAGRG